MTAKNDKDSWWHFIDAGTELNENGKTNCQVQGKTTRVRLKEQSKLKNKTAECGLMKSRA